MYNIEKILNDIQNRNSKCICIIGNIKRDDVLKIFEITDENDKIYFFGHKNDFNELKKEHDKFTSYSKPKLIPFVNESKLFDSYLWSLINYTNALKLAKQPLATMDFVYYSGKHIYIHDSGTLALVNKLLANKGYLVIYDYSWSISNSPSMNPSDNKNTSKNYPNTSFDVKQMELLSRIFLEDCHLKPDYSNKNICTFIKQLSY